jgi:uroporphyrin-3 C-methyltransferase
MDTNEPGATPTAASPAAAPPRAGATGTGARIAVLGIALAALAGSAWLWVDARARIGATQEEVARRLRGVEDEARESRSASRAAQEGAREAAARVATLEAKLADAQSQQAALEQLYQELSRNRDEWQLAEIEQVLAIAQQQLQLSGNVRAALLALELAESRLGRSDRPQFQAVRRALARDIERLKALPAADPAGLARRIDALLAELDSLPLASDARVERPAPPPPAAEAGAVGAAQRFGENLWRELRELVIVRRVDRPEPPLLPPTQAWFLRENLRLRLLNARLELLSRNGAGFAEDLRVARGWIERYFDVDARATREALAELGRLQAAPLNFEPPSISDSLDAVRAFKARRDRASG